MLPKLPTLVAVGTLASLVGLPAQAAPPRAPRATRSLPGAEGGAQPSLRFRRLHVIALDPGHGGSNRGCLGVDGTYEKVVTLQLSRRVADLLLTETDATPLLTRRVDEPLSLRQRSDLANAWGADVFLSIHINADRYGRGHGVETWYITPEAGRAAIDREVAALAPSVPMTHAPMTQPPTVHEPGPAHTPPSLAVRGLLLASEMAQAQADSAVLAHEVAAALVRHAHAPLRGVKTDAFGVLKGAHMPAIVVEVGFFSHETEGPKLLDPAYQAKLARGIVRGLLAYDRRLGGTTVAAATR